MNTTVPDCPNCGKWIEAATEAARERNAMKDRVLVLLSRMDMANRIITDNVEEVRNHVGGVIGYTLSLNAEQTRALWNAVSEPFSANAKPGAAPASASSGG